MLQSSLGLAGSPTLRGYARSLHFPRSFRDLRYLYRTPSHSELWENNLVELLDRQVELGEKLPEIFFGVDQ